MKPIKNIFAGGMIALGLTAPVTAQAAADTGGMICKDFLALDATAMMETTAAFRTDAMVASMLGGATDEEAMTQLMDDCAKMPDATLMDTMNMRM